jgi:hypothetical protein
MRGAEPLYLVLDAAVSTVCSGAVVAAFVGWAAGGRPG